MRFNSFLYIIFGMCIIGFSIGYVFGIYLHFVSKTYIYAYFAGPLLGLGSGFVIYGALFQRNIKN